MLIEMAMMAAMLGDCECEQPSGASCIGGWLESSTGIGPVPAGTEVTFTTTGWLYDCEDIVCPALNGGVVSMADANGVTIWKHEVQVCPGGETVLAEHTVVLDPADINHQVGGVRVFFSWGQSPWCLGCEDPSGYNGATGNMQLGTTVLIEGYEAHGVGDVDGSGEIDVIDLITIITHWGTINTAIDVPGAGGPPSEGIIDVSDLVAVIAAWEDAQ